MMSLRNSRLILALLLVAIVAVVVSLAGGWGRLVIDPAASILWLAWRVLLSIPGSVYWGLAILLGAWSLFRLAAVRRRADFRPAYQADELPPSRVDFWRSAIQEASLSRQDRKRLESALAELTGNADQADNSSLLNEVLPDNLLTRIPQEANPSASSRTKIQGEVRLGGFALPIAPPHVLRPMMRRLIQPNYRDIDIVLHKLEKEMELEDDINPDTAAEY